jgi:hypothetical protein
MAPASLETVRAWFNNYGPLVHLGRLAEADQLLRDCRDLFNTLDDTTMLATFYNARADLECQRGHVQDAVELQQTGLRFAYVHPSPRDIADSHDKLAFYLSHTAGNPADRRAHRLAAALLHHMSDDTHRLNRVLHALVRELRRDMDGPDAPVLPTTLSEVVRSPGRCQRRCPLR